MVVQLAMESRGFLQHMNTFVGAGVAAGEVGLGKVGENEVVGITEEQEEEEEGEEEEDEEDEEEDEEDEEEDEEDEEEEEEEEEDPEAMDLEERFDGQDERTTGSDECMKLWMEAQGSGEGMSEGEEKHFLHFQDVQEEVRVHQFEEMGEEEQEDVVVVEKGGGDDGGEEECEKEDDWWSRDAVATLLEAYEERLSELNRGSLRAKDWEVVASVVNKHLERTKSGLKTVKQCKRKVYSLKRWYKTARSRQGKGGLLRSEDAQLAVLDRIIIPLPWQAGIPGGIDAGERLFELNTTSFDEEDEDDAQCPAADDEPPTQGLGSVHSGGMKRNRDMESGLSDRPEVLSNHPQKIRLKEHVRRGHSNNASDRIAVAINGFTKVLKEIEKTKREIMRDLDARRTELQLNLAKMVKKNAAKKASAPTTIAPVVVSRIGEGEANAG